MRALCAVRVEMNDRDLVQQFLLRCVDDNVDSYKQLLEKLPRDEATDPYWIKLLDFYDCSNNENKQLIIERAYCWAVFPPVNTEQP